MKKIFLFFILLNFAMTGEARGMWMKTRTQPDKVEQTFGDDIFYYRNDDVEMILNVSKNMICIIPLDAHDWDFVAEGENRNIFTTISVVATFDLNNNRTGYWDDVVAMQSLDKSSLVLHEKIQLISNGENFRKIWDYLLTSSGSVVFRFTDINKGFVDYEIETIKTLGYDNAINGMHVDGDVDVLGL